MLKYKLIVIDQDEHGNEHLESVIGKFVDEDALERWAKGNKGELERSEYKP